MGRVAITIGQDDLPGALDQLREIITHYRETVLMTRHEERGGQGVWVCELRVPQASDEELAQRLRPLALW